MSFWKYEDQPQHVADQNYKSYMCDTPSDIGNLPTTVSPGSTCLVLSNSAVYILNSTGEWKEI